MSAKTGITLCALVILFGVIVIISQDYKDIKMAEQGYVESVTNVGGIGGTHRIWVRVK